MQQHSPFTLSGRGLATVFAVLLATGCAQCVPGKVGAGVARLTIRNIGTMVSLTNADTSCGFASSAVLGAPTMTGNVGGQGTLTFTVTDCAIDSGESKTSQDCDSVVTTTSGKFTISATRTITGTLTGNPMSPIIPAGPDAVTITVTKATFENFLVTKSNSENKLTMIKGSISGKVSPRLAVATATGACSIATPHAAFADVSYAMGSDLQVETPGNKFAVTSDGSALAAQNGTNGDHVNELTGTVTVFGKEVPAVESGDTDGLDPDYDAAKFESSYACTMGLAMPVSYTCADLRPSLAGGVARLSVRTLGTIASIVDANTMCGFSSTAVAGTPTFTGTVGADNSVATFTLPTAGCTITLPADTLLSTDCNMVTTKAGGTIVVTGTKKVTGFQTGNPMQPVVPTKRDPAEFDLSVTFTNFEVKKSDSTSSLLAKSGSLAGKVAPRTAINSTTGACSISTPVAAFTNLSWTNGAVRLNSAGNNFDLGVGASMISAQNGTKGTVSNTISGGITVDGTAYTLGATEVLDTAFVQATFDASYACTPNIVIPPVDAACSFRQALGTGVARLLVKSFATGTSMVNGNTTCGFASAAVLGAPTGMTGTAGMPGSIEWTATACAIGPLPADTTISTNCLGGTTKASGTVTASGTKTVTGTRTGMANPPIVPIARTAATLNMTSLNFNTFKVADFAMGATTTPQSLTLTGMGSVRVKPIAGESLANMGVYSVTTPVAGVEMLSMPTGTVTLVSNGSRFDLSVTAVALEAFTGSFGTSSNIVSGSLTVDGQPVTIAAMTPLDPAFMQAAYNSTYVCAPDLRAVIPFP